MPADRTNYHDRVNVARRPPEPAIDSFTWQVPIMDWKLQTILDAVTQAQVDGVPPDAQFQLAGDRIYLHWQREVRHAG